MSVELICSVLGLPPGRWPPDHYTLLGLEPGPIDPARVEERVLERMERLRPYQLAHPDTVTDAMNRLARALVHLTEPDTRKRPSEAGYPDAVLQPLPTPAPLPALVEEEPGASYGLVPEEPAVDVSVAGPALEVRPRRPSIRPRGDDARRQLYRRLATARRLRIAWQAAGRTLADAVRPLRQPVEAVELVVALWEIRRLADGDPSAAPPVGHTGQAGAIVGALARQANILHTFRHLLPDQRVTLAADWRAGADRIDETLRALQEHLRRPPRQRLGRALRRAGWFLVTDRLDLTLFVLGLAALGIALYRSR
jgi:hypothetical protein